MPNDPHEPSASGEIEQLIAQLDSPSPPPLAPAWPEDEAEPDATNAVEQLIARLDAPPPPAGVPQPAANQPWRWGLIVPALAVAAAAVLFALPLGTSPTSDPGRIGVRGGHTAGPIEALTLELDRVRDGTAARLVSGDRALVGDLIYFRLAARPPGAVSVWVEGPAGREEIAQVEATMDGGVLVVGGQHIAYALDGPGTHTFQAGQAGQGVPMVTVVVEVE